MPEERYWIVHRHSCTGIHPDVAGRPAKRVVGRVRRWGAAAATNVLAHLTAQALSHGHAALFREFWPPQVWDWRTAALTRSAGRLADAFRPRPLPAE